MEKFGGSCFVQIKLGFANSFSPSFLKAMLNVKEWSGHS